MKPPRPVVKRFLRPDWSGDTTLFKRPAALGPGTWQLRWYGRLTRVPRVRQNAFVRAYFKKVRLLGSERLEWLEQRKSADIPVGELPALPLGTVIGNTEVVPSLPLTPNSRWIDVRANFDRKRLQVVSRLLGSGSTLAEVTGLDSKGVFLADDPDYEGLLVVCEPDAEGVRLVIPCWAIFQFFLARDSTIANMLVDGRFVHHQRYVCDLSRSGLSGDGRIALIWLRTWIRDEQAKFIASLAFRGGAIDKDPIEAGVDIYKHLARLDGSQARCLRALPPYVGSMGLSVLASDATTSRGTFRIVQAISRCDYDPGFEAVVFDRDNDGRSDPAGGSGGEKETAWTGSGGDGSTTAGPPPPKGRKAPMPLSRPPQAVDIDDSPHAPDVPKVDIEIPWMRSSFSKLDEIPVVKRPQDPTRFRSGGTGGVHVSEVGPEISTIDDADSTGAGGKPTHAILSSGDGTQEDRGADTRPIAGSMCDLADDLTGFQDAELVVDGRRWLAHHDAVFAGDRVDATPFFVVPRGVGDPRRAWFYVDREKRQRKRALCLRVTFMGVDHEGFKARYLIDFEARSPLEGMPAQQNSILFFWNSGERPLQDEIAAVQHLIGNIGNAGTTDLAKSDMEGLRGRTRRHSKWGDAAMEPEGGKTRGEEVEAAFQRIALLLTKLLQAEDNRKDKRGDSLSSLRSDAED